MCLCPSSVGAISQVHVLPATSALLLQAKEGFRDEIGNGHVNTPVVRMPGEQWLFYGPGEYWPPLQVEVLRRIEATMGIEPLDLYLFRPDVLAFWVFVSTVFALILLLLNHYLRQIGLGGGEL